MTKDWDAVWSTITDEYVTQNKPLHEVQKILETRHNFKASTRAYRAQLLTRGVTKYRKRRHSAATTSKTSSSCGSSTHGHKSPRPRLRSPPYEPQRGAGGHTSPSMASQNHLFADGMFGATASSTLDADPIFASRPKDKAFGSKFAVQVKLEHESDLGASPFYEDVQVLRSPGAGVKGEGSTGSAGNAPLESFFDMAVHHHHHHHNHNHNHHDSNSNNSNSNGTSNHSRSHSHHNSHHNHYNHHSFAPSALPLPPPPRQDYHPHRSCGLEPPYLPAPARGAAMLAFRDLPATSKAGYGGAWQGSEHECEAWSFPSV